MGRPHSNELGSAFGYDTKNGFKEGDRVISTVYSSGVDLAAALNHYSEKQGRRDRMNPGLERLLSEAREYCDGETIADYEEMDKRISQLSESSRAYLMNLLAEKRRLTEMLNWDNLNSVLDRLVRILAIDSLHVKLVPVWFICPPAYGMWDDASYCITCFVRPTADTRFVAAAMIHEIAHMYVFKHFHSNHEGTVVAVSQALEMVLFPGQEPYTRGYPPLANYVLEAMPRPQEIKERVRRLLVGQVGTRSGRN